MDEYVCPWCREDTLENHGDMVGHLKGCESYRRVMFPEEFTQESPLCDGDEE